MRLIDADKFLKKVEKDREHEIYLHSWTADMVLERLDSWYAPTVEAIPKADYENRLKADLVAMLKELKMEIEKLPFDDEEPINITQEYMDEVKSWEYGKKDCIIVIQEKINALKENKYESY